jgi:hypothetical protein
MKNLNKKLDKELNHEMHPTKIRPINRDEDQFVVRSKEIEIGEGLDRDEVDFKMESKFEKKLDESDIDTLIRMRNTCNLNTIEMKQKVIKLKQTLIFLK